MDQIIVFGSKAKGTATEDSDLDLLLVIRDGDWKVKDAITQPGYLLALDRNAVPSMIVLTSENGSHCASERRLFGKPFRKMAWLYNENRECTGRI